MHTAVADVFLDPQRRWVALVVAAGMVALLITATTVRSLWRDIRAKNQDEDGQVATRPTYHPVWLRHHDATQEGEDAADQDEDGQDSVGAGGTKWTS